MTDGVPKMAQESLLTTIEHYQTTVRELERKAEQELQEERKITQDAKAARKKAEENTKLFEQLATETGEKLESVVKDLEKARRKSDLFDRYIDSGLNMTLQEFCKRYLDGIKRNRLLRGCNQTGFYTKTEIQTQYIELEKVSNSGSLTYQLNSITMQ